MKKCLAALLVLCVVLSLTSCRKKASQPGDSSLVSSLPTDILEEEDPGEGDQHISAAPEPLTPEDIAPVKRTPTTWAEYISEHPEAGEGHSFPALPLPDSENWELYAIANGGEGHCPLVGAKTTGTAYDKVRTRTAASGLSIELEKGDAVAMFDTSLENGEALATLMEEDWEDEFLPTFQRQSEYDGRQSGALRSYMLGGVGVFYGANTYRVQGSSPYMRRLNLCMYIDYGADTIVRVQMEEQKLCAEVEALDAWEGEMWAMADAIMAQYGKLGLNETVLGPGAMIADFDPV